MQIPENIRQGEDGRLLLVGGRHNVLRLFTGETRPAAGTVETFLSNHRQRREICAGRGISFSQWVFPDPITFPGSLGAGQGQSVLRAALRDASWPDDLHYPWDLIAPYPERQLKTDTHYSPLGAACLARAAANAAFGHDDPDHFARIVAQASLKSGYRGDLAVQCDPPPEESRLVLPGVPALQSASSGLQAGNNGIIHLIRSEQAVSERRLLIFGDSFFRSMLGELARYWRTIIFLRTPFFHSEMLNAVAPDDIFGGMAERYFPSVQPDAERPHFLAWPLMQGRGTNPDPGFAELWSDLIDSRALATVTQ